MHNIIHRKLQYLTSYLSIHFRYYLSKFCLLNSNIDLIVGGIVLYDFTQSELSRPNSKKYNMNVPEKSLDHK